MRKFTDEQAAALVVAGRLLQSKNWPSGRKKIEPLSDENYPEAVLRAICALPKEEQEMLRELTSWVREYSKAGE